MSKNTKSDEKAALKQLREERKERIKEVRDMNKIQNKKIEDIRQQIISEGKTVPEISRLTGIDSAEVMQYIASLIEYGLAAEGAKEGDYFKYHFLEK